MKPKHWLESWHVSATLNRDYDSIDGLRGIAILMVVACHLLYVNPEASPHSRFIMGIFAAGTFGVPIFFVLSGFLISHPFWTRKFQGRAAVVPTGYAARRFWKIYPPLALSIAVLTPIYVALRDDPSHWIVALQWLTGWSLFQPVSSKLNPVMWSLVVEVHFYIVLPIVFLLLRRVSYHSGLWIITFFFILIPTAARWYNYSRGEVFDLSEEINTHFPAHLDAFAFGLFLAGLEAEGKLKGTAARLAPVGFILLILALLGYSWVTLEKGTDQIWKVEILNWVVKIAAVFLLCVIATPATWAGRLLANPALRWFGLISYEWYLIHQPLVLWGREIFGPAGGNPVKYVAIVGGAFLLSLTVAAGTYRWFSLPILRRGRAKHKADREVVTERGGDKNILIHRTAE